MYTSLSRRPMGGASLKMHIHYVYISILCIYTSLSAVPDDRWAVRAYR